ncbi:MAG: tetratricopeptide repeat protein [Spirochaetaceae bacterium]|nr:tetratricopeptide repeat protein [Spirochaetaceae bacterium]
MSSLLVLTGCTKKSANFSFATSMDTVDSMIALGQMKEANDLLKDASTVASEPNEWFAIYKRYIRTGNTKEAGKLIKKAYKKCPGNAEVAAVYAHHLIQEKNYDDAYKVAVRLENTPYGSILSELRLKKAKAENNYLKREFVQTFCDAAYATGNDRYLRNAAVIEAYNGFIQNALALHPNGETYNEDKLFWALISYDAGNFAQTYIDLAMMESSAEVMMLKADAALYLDEQKSAFEFWKGALKYDPGLSPVPYYNLAHYAELNDMQAERGEFLILLMKYFPDYVPGLAAYGNYAYDITHREPEDAITSAVRKAGFKSLNMEQRDTAPVVPVEDALARMEELIAKTGDEAITVERAKLQWRNADKSPDQKLVDVWFLLEKYPENENLKYYAVWLLCKLKRYDEAQTMFSKFLVNKYGNNDIKDIVSSLSALECEYAAYLSAINVPNEQTPDYKLAVKLYQNLVAHDTKSVPVLMNYGLIRYSESHLQEAFDLYNKALRLTSDETMKAEIQYRMGCVYAAQKNMKDALMCLSYCLQLNPEHAKARLLYKRLEGLAS